MTTVLCVFALYYEWVFDKLEIIQWPFFAALLVATMFAKDNRKALRGESEINRIIRNYPWVKTYIGCYGFIVAIAVNYVIFRKIDIYEIIGTPGILYAILLMVLPMIIIKQREIYKNAGKEI